MQILCFVQKLDKTAFAQAADLHFSPILHYIKTFVEHEPLMLYVHLLGITVAGFLWPLQVGTETPLAQYAGCFTH